MPESVSWERMGAEAREAYERQYGVKPPGYRGTGKVEWFQAWHPTEAPCCKCGVTTDRWVIGLMYIGKVAWGGATYRGHAFCAETHYPFCERCERRASIATLERRQQNAGILESVRAGEAQYLAELKAEEAAQAA